MTPTGDPQTVGDAVENRYGYRGPIACSVAGVTYRQLDYWCRTGIVVPSIRPAGGSGTQRLYSRDDIVRLSAVRHLLELGLSLDRIRRSLDELLDSQVIAGDATDQGETVAALSLDVTAIRVEALVRLLALPDATVDVDVPPALALVTPYRGPS